MASTLPKPISPVTRVGRLRPLLLGALVAGPGGWAVAAPSIAEEFDKEIEPILSDYCYDCHGDGASKGDVVMDEYENLADHLEDHGLWLRAWQNIRSQLMPPSKKAQPEREEREQLLRWIEARVFKLDPENPDPGRVTIRRMNREEYRNTIHDLLGVDYDTGDKFPPDDTGYGFDTIGDVLSISPLLLEKYLTAAEEIAAMVLPTDAARTPELVIQAGDLRQPGKESETGRSMEFERNHTVRAERPLRLGGQFEVELEFRVTGARQATEQTATLALLVDGKELARRDLDQNNRKPIRLSGTARLEKGKRRFEVRIIPRKPEKTGQERLVAQVTELRLKGPLDAGWSAYPEPYRRILFDGPAPEGDAARRSYAAKVFRRLATRTFRRPVDDRTVGRLAEMAMAHDRIKGNKFEDGVRLGLTALLASPRFLFRAEIQPEPDNPAKIIPIDEFALASRLSYFLWSSMPDDPLFELAGKGALRKNLEAQIERMLADPKADRFVRNFTGQWLQARDVESVPINARSILGVRRLEEANRVFNTRLRSDMRRETEALFAEVLRNDRPATELLTADYSFLNERLAKFYGIPGIRGEQHRRVKLDPQTHRGGILTHGSFLIVTSNPTRTSPVKRGLFVLDNLLGTPPPPPPPGTPDLEEAARKSGKPLTMREMMVRHREDPLCKSCHARMDPIGLALENYNALGLWRDQEGGKPIDTSGVLVTGEKFSTAQDLREVLATGRQTDFLRCLTEKMLTYAIGRGVEYFDAPTIDRIVADAGKSGGSLQEIVKGIVRSAPFQKRRGDGG